MSSSPARRLAEAPRTIRGKKLDTALTAVLIATKDLDVVRLCLARFAGGESSIDAELVKGLYLACDRRLKLELACSAVVDQLPPRPFRRIFLDAYHRLNPDQDQRRHLAWTLELFLKRHPDERPAYREIVMEMLQSRGSELRCRALTLAGLMRNLDARALFIYDRSLDSKRADFRLNALNGLYKQVEQLDGIAPRFRELVLSDEFRRRVSRMHRLDPDEHVRRNAWVLLKLLRRAAAAGRHR